MFVFVPTLCVVRSSYNWNHCFFIVMLDLNYNIWYCFLVDNIQNQATFDNNEPLVNFDDEREPPLSPSMIATNYDRQPIIILILIMVLIWFLPVIMILKNYKVMTMFHRLRFLLVVLQSWPKYARQSLVSVWNSALREKFNFNFWTVFRLNWQNFHFGRKTGH